MYRTDEIHCSTIDKPLFSSMIGAAVAVAVAELGADIIADAVTHAGGAAAECLRRFPGTLGEESSQNKSSIRDAFRRDSSSLRQLTSVFFCSSA